MNFKEMVIADFQEFIALDPSVPSELRDSLKVKERAPLFIENLTGQLHEIVRVKPHIKLDRMKIKALVQGMTNTFIHLLKQKVEEAHMSDLAKSAMKAEIEGDPITQKFDDQGNADLTEELGIKIIDKV